MELVIQLVCFLVVSAPWIRHHHRLLWGSLNLGSVMFSLTKKNTKYKYHRVIMPYNLTRLLQFPQ